MRFTTSHRTLSISAQSHGLPFGCLEIACYLGLTALLVLFAFFGSLSGSALITPINPIWYWGVIGFGMAMVVIVFYASGLRGWRRGMTLWGGVKRVFFFGLTLMIAFATTGALAAELANRWAFWGVHTEWQDASYGVYGVAATSRHGRSLFSRSTVRIDPFATGRSIRIPVPEWQRRQLDRIIPKPCIRVRQRVAPSGAVQIATNGSATWSEPTPVIVVPCPA